MLGLDITYLDIPPTMLGRVTGPTVLVRENGRALSVDWAFNAWGGNYDGLYQDYESDLSGASRFSQGHRSASPRCPSLLS